MEEMKNNKKGYYIGLALTLIGLFMLIIKSIDYIYLKDGLSSGVTIFGFIFVFIGLILIKIRDKRGQILV
ncbi:MAG: hypothetical protein Q8N99_02305 [Nanoarchaeota archaeon]|nr:hypothetical protein [Nanoarchaeota archaeon]